MPGSRRRSVLTSRLAGSVLGNPQGTVLEQLRRCILDGEVPPGSPIPVDDVAAVCGVSRIPVREALMTLIGEGLVDHRAHAGYRVAQLTAQELTEIYLVREALEATALRYAVEQATPGDHDLAREAHADLERAVVAGDPRAHHRESRRFHLALIAPCRMHRLLHMLAAAWNMTEPLQPMAHLPEADLVLLHADHAGMLAAFVARDADALTRLCTAHHHRLQSSIALLPTDTGLFADPG